MGEGGVALTFRKLIHPDEAALLQFHGCITYGTFYARISSQSEADLVSFTEVEHTAERERLKTETKNRKRPVEKAVEDL